MLTLLLYYEPMIAARGPTIIELDERASEKEKPFGIITVDCSSPREIDDGIAVEPLPANKELYRAHVFVADTSGLYIDEAVTRQVIEKTEARYLNPQADQETYEPMLDELSMRRLELRDGGRRSALVVSFLVGESQSLSEVEVSYGKFEVIKNYRYDKFGKKCRYDPEYEKYGRAAAFISQHIRNSVFGSPDEAYAEIIHVPKTGNFRRGANINQAFMVAANYLVAHLMASEPLAIFRTHDPEDNTFRELMSSRVARFSTTPGPHVGLGLDMYTRVTSPLRRAEDFIMHGLLRARHEGRPISKRDQRLVLTTVQRLNQRVVTDVFRGRMQMNDEELWLPTNRSEERLLG